MLCVLLLWQPAQEYEAIVWEKDNPLSWKDFKGEIPASSRAAATTASGITYRYSATGNQNNFEVNFDVHTMFYPNKSWYNPELCDASILKHEQLHFDISELYARTLKKRLTEGRYTRQNVRAKVKKIYKEVTAALNDYQNLYDRETNFSRNQEVQKVWNKKISLLLNE